ncbi:MAG: hypothetical protein AAGN46_01205 [Acidobacteriota bacterium]
MAGGGERPNGQTIDGLLALLQAQLVEVSAARDAVRAASSRMDRFLGEMEDLRDETDRAARHRSAMAERLGRIEQRLDQVSEQTAALDRRLGARSPSPPITTPWAALASPYGAAVAVLVLLAVVVTLFFLAVRPSELSGAGVHIRPITIDAPAQPPVAP